MVTEEQQQKTAHLINETHDAYKAGYEELHETIRGIRRSFTTKEKMNETLNVCKDLSEYIKNLALMTTMKSTGKQCSNLKGFSPSSTN